MTELSEQAAKILGPLSGTATVWSLALGIRLGIFEQLQFFETRPRRGAGHQIANPDREKEEQ